MEDKNYKKDNLKKILELFYSGNYKKAKETIFDFLKFSSDSATLYSILGVIYSEENKHDEAIQYHSKAIKINPSYAEAYNNLGSALCKKGNFEEGLNNYKKAIKIKPNFAKAHNNIGKVLVELKDYTNAIQSLNKVIELEPDNIVGYYNLANSYMKIDRLGEALKYCDRVLNLNPEMIKALNMKFIILNRLVPPWQAPMINDNERNNFYFSALKSAINIKSNIFEIGTGSGLLSIMAANLGAHKINTCEANPIIAKTAINVISDNNLSKKINVIQKKSNYIKIGTDIDKTADILVSEIFSNELLGEGVLESLEDAKRRLISKNAKIIPEYASIMISLFGGNDIEKNIYANNFRNIKLNKFNSIISKKRILERQDLKLSLMSNIVEAFYFDFVEKHNFPNEEKKIEVKVTKNGKSYGIIQWIKIGMKDGLKFENHPLIYNATSHWQQVLYIFDNPIELKIGKKVIVTAKHDRNIPWFFLDKIL